MRNQGHLGPKHHDTLIYLTVARESGTIIISILLKLRV